MNIQVERDHYIRDRIKSKYIFNFNVYCSVFISRSIPSTTKMRLDISLPLKPYKEECDNMAFLGSPRDTSDSDN